MGMTVRMTTSSLQAAGAALIIADLVIICLCFALAMVLRLESIAFLTDGRSWLVLATTALATLPILVWLGLYRLAIGAPPERKLRIVALGAALSAALLSGVAQVFSAPIPYTAAILYGLLLFISLAGARLPMRHIFSKRLPPGARPVAIYGAGEAGRQLSEMLSHGQEYLPVAFIDDKPELRGKTIGSLPVYAPNQIQSLLEAVPISGIILAEPTASRARRRETVAQLEPLGLEIKTIAATNDHCTDGKTAGHVRPDAPEDLFGCSISPPRAELMRQQITDKVVLVTGAGGCIGSELCRQIVGYNPAALIMLDMLEAPLDQISSELRQTLARDGRAVRIEPLLGSVRDPDRISTIFRLHNPETVYHAAAYTSSALAEANVVEALRNNAFGTRVIAEAAASSGARNFIMTSTDEAAQPRNFMAASRRLAELICQAFAAAPARTVFSVVRMGNVLTSSGSMISRIQAQIDQGGPVTLDPHESEQFFMPPAEVAQLVIQAGALSEGGEIYVIDMGEPVSALELARTMIRLRGLRPWTEGDPLQNDARRDQATIQISGLDAGARTSAASRYGKSPEGTAHPQILRSLEPSLSLQELQPVLERLDAACARNDLREIKALLTAAPVSCSPTDGAVDDDPSGRPASAMPAARPPKLRVVRNED